MGEYLPQQSYFTIPNLSASFAAPDMPLGERSLFEVGNLGAAPFVYAYRSETFSDVYAGDRMLSFFDDWYFRVHFFPLQLSFGTFAQQITRSVTIWNAYPYDRQLLSVDLVDSEASGVLFSAPLLPFTFKPLAIAPASFTALQRGPDAISEVGTLNFAAIGDRDLAITGFRIQPPDSHLWPFKPNWSTPWSATYEWKTDIISSRNGTEQRRATRVAPRRSLSFANVVRPEAQIEFKRMISRRSKGTFAVADPTTHVLVSVPVSNQDSAILTAVPWWVAPDKYVVFEYGEQRVRRQVKEVDGPNVTFWLTDGLSWPAGTRVYPGLVCELPDEFSTTRRSQRVSSYNVTFEVVPGSSPLESLGTPFELFDGREVLPFRHNWTENQTLVFLRPSELVGFPYGVQDRFYPAPTPRFRVQLTTSFKSSAEAATLRQFATRMRGRQGEFYMSLGTDDLVPHLDLLPNVDTQYLRTEGSADFLAYRENETARAIEVVLFDGTVLRRVIDSVEYVDDMQGESTQFNLRGQWPYTILLADIQKVSFLHVWRLSSDTYDESWDTSSVCRVQINFETLKREEAEPA